MTVKQTLTAEQLAERLREDPDYVLSREDAVAIIRKAFGSRPDLPPGEVVVREIRDSLGSIREL
ncbi:MAG TPA: hypothetical protein PJ994_06645 [Tepidiformaceae bacterium]|nr:hypothetical protein [Tepidiformaceae bacterium]HMO95357.1 hypothetical protein [Tepidiformaceae bacterium]